MVQIQPTERLKGSTRSIFWSIEIIEIPPQRLLRVRTSLTMSFDPLNAKKKEQPESGAKRSGF